LLRFFAQVVDEADRLLTQSFQDWLKQILGAIRPPPASLRTHEEAPVTKLDDDVDQWLVPHHDALDPAHLAQTACIAGPILTSDFDEPLHSSCQKLLFSATLTSNPSKIAELTLRDAKWFVVKGKSEEDVEAAPLLDEGFELPPGLRVHRAVYTSPPVALTLSIRNIWSLPLPL
jgi:ATP-dependent RNA helicase DDX51/DBP6